MDLSELINKLPVAEQEKLFEQVAQYKDAVVRERAQKSFMSFVHEMWPGFIHGRHHALMAKKFEEIAAGTLKRLIINMPPRHTKSEFASNMLPAWFLGNYPHKKVIQTSNTAELVGGTVTGKGADLLIIDDPHSEQEARLAQGDPTVFDGVYEWYTSGPRQRLQPGGAIIIVMTRWSDKDLTGKVLKNDNTDWEVIELPAIMPSGKSLWPEFWALEELEALREELPAYKWNAQYQQKPTGEEGAIVKRDWWRRWEPDRPPRCEFIIQSWDTAFTKSQRADYSACTTWGVFHLNEDEANVNIILLDAYKNKMEFPELKDTAKRFYDEWEPDACIIEAKAAGAPLIYELRAMGVMVSDYTPVRGNDKFVRINSVTDLFRSGKVWAPDTRWADELIEEMARFPNAEHDDLTDSATQALIRFRQGGFLRLDSDEQEDEIGFRRKKSYY